MEVGLSRLNELLPSEWVIEDHVSPSVSGPLAGSIPQGVSGDSKLITIRDTQSNGGWGTVLVAVRKELTPVQAQTVLAPQVELMRALQGEAAVLVIAPWLSARTRTALHERGYGYLDLTGNVLFRLRTPAVYIKDVGAVRDPSPRRSVQGVSGPKAGRLIRLLAEFRPPYRATELARIAELSISYVSRLLDALEQQALLRREGRYIIEIDWPNLLRARAENYNVLRSNEVVSFLAPHGVTGLIDQLRTDNSLASELRITGSVAAATMAPVTVGGQFMAYMPGASRNHAETTFADKAGLLPVTRGANVAVLLPQDSGVLHRWEAEPAGGEQPASENTDGLRYAPYSQIVIDCLGGNGRMPAEGEAVLQKMIETEEVWRLAGLPEHWVMS